MKYKVFQCCRYKSVGDYSTDNALIVLIFNLSIHLNSILMNDYNKYHSSTPKQLDNSFNRNLVTNCIIVAKSINQLN